VGPARRLRALHPVLRRDRVRAAPGGRLVVVRAGGGLARLRPLGRDGLARVARPALVLPVRVGGRLHDFGLPALLRLRLSEVAATNGTRTRPRTRADCTSPWTCGAGSDASRVLPAACPETARDRAAHERTRGHVRSGAERCTLWHAGSRFPCP
jgi:hypothetical protein